MSIFTQVLKYKFEVLVLYLSVFFSCHFLLLLHHVHLTALVILQIKIFADKSDEEFIKCDVLS